MAISSVAWFFMLAHGHGSHGWALCLASPNVAFIANLSTAWRSGALSDLFLGWGIMVIAMMPPLAIPLIRHVAVRSFAVRRDRAVAAFLAGMLAVWLLAGVIALTVLSGVPAALLSQPKLGAAAFLIAAAWQLAPAKRAALARCHRIVPLGAIGWRADRDCVRYGLAHGLDCLATCWASMFALVLASGGPVICVGVQLIALIERRSRRPRPGLSALALMACALLMLPI